MSFELQTGQNSHQFSCFSCFVVEDSDWLMRFAICLGRRSTLVNRRSIKEFAGVISEDFFLYLRAGFGFLNDSHGILELIDRRKVAAHEQLAFPHHISPETNLLRIPERRRGVDEDAFLVFVKKPLVPLVPKSRVHTILQREEGAAQVGKNETQLGKAIHRS